MQALLAATTRNRNVKNDEDILDMSKLYVAIADEAYVLANQMISARDVP